MARGRREVPRAISVGLNHILASKGNIMRRVLYIAALAIASFVTPGTSGTVSAQSLTIGRGGVQYNAYGRGYYGGYGRGYQNNNGYYRTYRPYGQSYYGYGDDAYGYGPGNSYQSPYSNGNLYGSQSYYNGYGHSGYSNQYYTPSYSPYGVGFYTGFDNAW